MSKKLLQLATYSILLLAGLVISFPILWMITVSVRPNVEVLKIPPTWLPEVFTLNAYREVLTNHRYVRCFVNSYFIAGAVTLIALTLGSLSAYALSRFTFIGKRLIMGFLVVTQMFPLVLLTIPYFQVLVSLRLYDTLLSLVIVYTTLCLPFSILMLKSYFAEIPRELEEAAMVDGCSRLQAIWRIIIPLSGPALVGTGLYTFLLAWNEFLFAVVLIESWSNRVVTMAIYSLLAEFVTEWNMMMAFSVVASLPLVVAFIFLQKYVVRGMTVGAIK